MTNQTNADEDFDSSVSSPFLDVAELLHSELDRIDAEAGHQGMMYQNPDAEVQFAVNEIAGLLEGTLKVRVRLGNELFRFTSYSQWVNKASSWFRGVRLRDGYGYVCVDSKGRICQIGKHFMRARDDNSFPVVVYSVE